MKEHFLPEPRKWATPSISDRSPAISIHGRYTQRSKYRAMCILYIIFGFLVELLAFSSVSPYLCLLLLIPFGLLGVITRCPVCETSIAYFPEDVYLWDSWNRCCSCGRFTVQKGK